MTPTCTPFYNQYACLTFLSPYLLYLYCQCFELGQTHPLNVLHLNNQGRALHIYPPAAVSWIPLTPKVSRDHSLGGLPVLVHFSFDNPFYMGSEVVLLLVQDGGS